MPSIYGIVARSAPGVIDALLTQMLAGAPKGAAKTSALQASTQAGLAATFRILPGTERAPHRGIATSAGRWLAFTGKIIEDEAFQLCLKRLPVQTPERFCDRLLAIYNYQGMESLEGLNGQYALAIWEERTQRLLLLNDRYGLQPIYYWRGPHEFVFSTQLKAFSVYPTFPRRVDPVALADLLASGQMLGEHTLYDGVQAMPPATRLLFEAGYLAMETYARLPFYVPGWAEPDMQEAVRGLDLNLQAAVSRRMNDDARLLLTGGLDSRLLAGYLGECVSERRLVAPKIPVTGDSDELIDDDVALFLSGISLAETRENATPKNVTITASTIGLPRSSDVLLARAVAEQAGLPYEVLPANTGYLRDYAARAVEITEGNLNAYAAWIFQEEEHLRVSPSPALLTGVGGEGLSGRHPLAGLNAPDEQQALNWLLNQHWQYNLAAELLRPELRQAVAESQAYVSSALLDSPEEQLTSRYDDFHYKMMRRHPTGNLLNHVVDVYEPYLDNDLVDYCLRLPPELRASGKVFQELLRWRFPRLAAIPGAHSQPRPGLMQRAWRQLNRRLRQTLFFLSPAPYGDDLSRVIPYNHWMRNAARSYITGLLTGELLGDTFNMRVVNRVLNDHMTGRSNAYRTLGALVTYAEWRKSFL